MAHSRSPGGSSLIELLITVVVMTLASVAIFGLLLSTMHAGRKLNNKLDTIDAARVAVEKISKDVRMARNLGDVTGNEVTLVGPTGQQETVIRGSAVFPSNQNPLYGHGQSPPHGWPSWGDGQVLQSYNMTETSPDIGRTLVVQVPLFDAQGWPARIPGIAGPARENVETHIYRVVPDPSRANEWMMQWVKIPGAGGPNIMDPANHNMVYDPHQVRPFSPQTLVTGIVGPLGNNGQPRVFQFIDKYNSTASALPYIPSTESQGQPSSQDDMAAYTGVIINLEIQQHNDSSRTRGDSGKYVAQSRLAIRTESFLRNNAGASVIGMPSPIGTTP